MHAIDVSANRGCIEDNGRRHERHHVCERQYRRRKHMIKLGKTQPYIPKRLQDPTMLPMVRYAKAIGKNTAEFTQHDLRKFLRWLWQTEPYKYGVWQPTVTRYFGGKREPLKESTGERQTKRSTQHHQGDLSNVPLSSARKRRCSARA